MILIIFEYLPYSHISSLFLVCVSYFRAILRLCMFLMCRWFRKFSDRAFYGAFGFFRHVAEFLLSHNRDDSFSQLCVIFKYFFCVFSISPSSWQIATTSASFTTLIQSLAKYHYYSTAPSFNLLFLHYALRVSSRETYPRLFLEGGHSYIVDKLVL